MVLKIKLTKSHLIAIIVIVIIIGLGSWSIIDIHRKINSQIDDLTQDLIVPYRQIEGVNKIKAEVLTILDQSEARHHYGSWPITRVNLSVDRGNPFEPKR